jgi:predicted nucleic acid-binding Zn ribbon protein
LRSDRRAEGARGLLEQALERALGAGHIEIAVKGNRYALRPKCLLGAAWLELGDRVLGARPEKTCPQCGGAFVPPTARRVFCSEKCKDDAKNERRKQQKKKTTRRKRS